MVGGILIERNYIQEDWPVIITKTLAIEGVLLAAFALAWYLTDPVRNLALENVLICYLPWRWDYRVPQCCALVSQEL